MLDFVVRVCAEVEAGRKLQPGRRPEQSFLPPEDVGNGARVVVRSVLRKQGPTGFDEAGCGCALRRRRRVVQENDGSRKKQPSENPTSSCQRRSACTVKSESLSGKLYWIFSSTSRVRLPRGRSLRTISCAAQIPSTEAIFVDCNLRTTSSLM